MAVSIYHGILTLCRFLIINSDATELYNQGRVEMTLTFLQCVELNIIRMEI